MVSLRNQTVNKIWYICLFAYLNQTSFVFLFSSFFFYCESFVNSFPFATVSIRRLKDNRLTARCFDGPRIYQQFNCVTWVFCTFIVLWTHFVDFCYFSFYSLKHIDINLWLSHTWFRSSTPFRMRIDGKHKTHEVNWTFFFIVLPLPMAHETRLESECDRQSVKDPRKIRTIYVYTLSMTKLICTLLNRKCVYQSFDTN